MTKDPFHNVLWSCPCSWNGCEPNCSGFRAGRGVLFYLPTLSSSWQGLAGHYPDFLQGVSFPTVRRQWSLAAPNHNHPLTELGWLWLWVISLLSFISPHTSAGFLVFAPRTAGAVDCESSRWRTISRKIREYR